MMDIHFYPGESNALDIVQLHRVYFDRNYVYPGNNGVHRIGGWEIFTPCGWAPGMYEVIHLFSK